jgi:trans-aconitate 2-methyltransferase
VIEREHWLSITDDPEWRRNHINDPSIPLGETLGAIIEAFPMEPRRILEIGCGYGRLTTEVAQRFPYALVAGIDINAKILPENSLNITYLGFDNVRSFENYDAVYSVAVFQHLPYVDQVAYISDSYFALAPGGVLRVQFIDGERTNFCDYWTPAESMESWFTQAGFNVSNVDQGLAHPQWTWITGVK